ncbi:unknown [Candidatus Colimorpha enterica]|uniref:Uncharacterized protein n=1 Tax=Candidatus Colimorpha enterica TaxID=3083063 RepID=R6U686_9BACT|nr:unknown [Candidatus Colimorpha enterica]
MGIEKLALERGKSRGSGGGLGQNVNAVSIAFDHAFKPADLSLYPTETVDEPPDLGIRPVLLATAVVFHNLPPYHFPITQVLYTLRGYLSRGK